ncbi:MAG: hypothetical protein JNL88_09665 [Bacteroidia bacterium]|nr:hypothetical protein [Bacteroidia bacterium]
MDQEIFYTVKMSEGLPVQDIVLTAISGKDRRMLPEDHEENINIESFFHVDPFMDQPR